ncbi:MAG: hypothetical protein IMZ52_01870 [Actinobacteria bacterium]|nr:hypothetical protein [Actinomycetota bacterium]
MIGYKNQHTEISCKLDDGNTQQYPYVVIKDSDNNTEITLSLIHKFSGQYADNTWTPMNNGYFKANYAVYSDLAHTTLNTNYTQGAETIWIIDELSTSSQVTESTYGGGGRGQIAVVGGRKSPWTHKLRDDIIQNVEETKKMVADINKKITDYYNDEMKAIDALVGSLEQLYTKIKSSSKSDTDKVLSEIEYSIKVLKENREKLRNINIINEIPNIKKEIVKVSTMASMLLSDEMVEKLVLDEKKEEK